MILKPMLFVTHFSVSETFPTILKGEDHEINSRQDLKS